MDVVVIETTHPLEVMSVILIFSLSETITELDSTVTLHVAFIPLSSDIAYISAEPGDTAETFPSETLATDAFELLHMTVLLLALLGDTVAVIVVDSPSLRVMDVGLMIRDVTGTVVGSGFSFCEHEQIITESINENQKPILSFIVLYFTDRFQIQQGWSHKKGRNLVYSTRPSGQGHSNKQILPICTMP